MATLATRQQGNVDETDGTQKADGPPPTLTRHSPVSLVGSCTLPTRYGRFRMEAYEVEGIAAEFICLSVGNLASTQTPLVRLHSECLTGDVLGSLRCDCGEQLAASLELIRSERVGLLLYLRQEGRGIGLVNKIKAYELQEQGLDTIDANLALGLPVDSREYASSAEILKHLGLRRIRLLTNNLAKVRVLRREGLEVERVPLVMPPNPLNLAYLRAKAERMGHLIDFPDGREKAG